jgi:competence CoiA-like predicted nuclease
VELKLPYIVKNNALLTVEEVKGGLACGCICPACKKQLIARKGEIKIYHFAHYNSDDCKSGLETALHMILSSIRHNSGAKS